MPLGLRLLYGIGPRQTPHPIDDLRQGVILDLNYEGAQAALPETVRVGTRLSLLLIGDLEIFPVEAEVAWTRPAEDIDDATPYEHGLKFLQPTGKFQAFVDLVAGRVNRPHQDG